MSDDPYVYLMRRADGAWKIGFSSDPGVRRKGLQSYFGVSFRIVKLWRTPNAYRIERISQRLLRVHMDLSVRGRETFRAPKKTIMAAINEAIWIASEQTAAEAEAEVAAPTPTGPAVTVETEAQQRRRLDIERRIEQIILKLRPETVTNGT